MLEKKPSTINQQRVGYKFHFDLCDASYVGYTLRHLHQRAVDHTKLSSSIGTVLSRKTLTDIFPLSRNTILVPRGRDSFGQHQE